MSKTKLPQETWGKRRKKRPPKPEATTVWMRSIGGNIEWVSIGTLDPRDVKWLILSGFTRHL
jgi:hypothetical protein